MEETEKDIPMEVSEDKDGKHMQLLSKSLSLTIQKFLSGVKLSLFKANFKPIYKQNPEALKKIHLQMSKQLEDNINDEIMQMFKEENIASLMNQLDEIIQNKTNHASHDQEAPAWRPTRQPDLDILAHAIPVKKKENGHLEHVASELEMRNKLLREALKARQKKLMDTKEKIDKHVERWQQAAAVSESMPVDEMKSFIQKHS